MQLLRVLRTFIVLAAGIALAAIPAVAADFSIHVSVAPEWNQLFQNTNGWIGADVAYSVPLGREKVLWLFGDTFVGHIRHGRRIQPKMIHSSIAIQKFAQPPRFYYPEDKKGQPESFVKSPGPRTYFWLEDGMRTSRGLCIFLQEVKWINDSAWGFQCIGTWLALVHNPDDSPALWKISLRPLPFARLADGQDAVLGTETLKTGGYVYVYGYSNRTNATATKNQILARAAEDELANPDAWKFYSNGGWTKDFQIATPIFPDAGAEGSVSWQPFLKKFVFIYSEGIWGRIVMRTSTSQEGPWTAPEALYQCPEMKISPHVFCYAAKGHPELSATNELLVSYASNSEKPSDVMNNTNLYVPRFIRVIFKKP